MKNIDLTNKKIGLYTPYLDVLGGGEKYILSILEEFFRLGGKIYVFWDKNNLKKSLKERFNFQFINEINWLPLKLKTPFYLKRFDYFFYVTDGSYFFSLAKKNFIYAMVPKKELYNLSIINRLKIFNYQFITHSYFVQSYLKKIGIKSTMIYPYINLFKSKTVKKQKIILSVGRFFPQLHSKKQDLIIKTFFDLKKYSQFKDYSLILAGGLKKEDENYFNQLKSIAKKDSSIIFKPNIPFQELYSLYQKASYFWHFTGYGVDENQNPELVEHLGLTPLEAMANQIIVFCYQAGGPKEIIKDGFNGFLFKDDKDLIKKMLMIEKKLFLKKNIIHQAKLTIEKKFNKEIFKNKVIQLI